MYSSGVDRLDCECIPDRRWCLWFCWVRIPILTFAYCGLVPKESLSAGHLLKPGGPSRILLRVSWSYSLTGWWIGLNLILANHVCYLYLFVHSQNTWAMGTDCSLIHLCSRICSEASFISETRRRTLVILLPRSVCNSTWPNQFIVTKLKPTGTLSCTNQ